MQRASHSMHSSASLSGERAQRSSARLGLVGQDFVIGGITLAAILLLVGTGTSWIGTMVQDVAPLGDSRSLITSTLLLNIALILFGWRRYRDLRIEIARRSAAEEESIYLAMHDPLTGFLNRRGFTESATEHMPEWRNQGMTPALLVIDIDAFKSINDLYGHASGDAVIVLTADRISGCCPPDAIVARLGGDEFAVLVPIKDMTALDTLGSVLTDTLSEPIKRDAFSITSSSSVGGALATAPDVALDALLRHADSAMYRAKRLGRCRYERFDEAMSVTMNHRDVVERELRQAIADDALYPAYEPMVDLASGTTIGYEMLARWDSPQLGVMSPAEFIAVAETAGLISSLSDQLFRKALREAIEWPGDLSLSLNISPLQLRDPWFAQKLLKLLSETGFPPQRLIVELTETAIVDNIPLALAVFTSLRNQGIRIALDDFGTGYSSVASLRALPFDSIKLDQEFVTRMGSDPERGAIAEAVLHLGQSLGLPVIAEGIESAAIAERLGGLDCATGQGHYFSKAMSHEAVMQHHSHAAENQAKSA